MSNLQDIIYDFDDDVQDVVNRSRDGELSVNDMNELFFALDAVRQYGTQQDLIFYFPLSTPSTVPVNTTGLYYMQNASVRDGNVWTPLNGISGVSTSSFSLRPHPSQHLFGYVGMRGTFCQRPLVGGDFLYLTRQVFRRIPAPPEPDLGVAAGEPLHAPPPDTFVLYFPTNELLHP